MPEIEPLAPPRNPANIHWNRWHWYVLLAACLHFAVAYTVDTSPFLRLRDFAAGHEQAPFQYRALTAWIYAALGSLPLPAKFALYLPLRLRSADTFVTLGLTFGSLLLGTWTTARSIFLLTADRMASRWWSLLVIAMCYFHYLLSFGHPCCAPFQLPYDLPAMALFALCLWLIVAGHDVLLFPAFSLATLNRESSLFIIAVLLLYRSVGIRNVRSPGVRRLALQVAGLTATWIAIEVLLHRLYHPRPLGEGVAGFGFHVFDNLLYLARPYYWGSYASIYGFSWLFLYSNGLRIPHAGIRRALLVTPVYVGALYIAGVLSEIRIFGELISLHVVALALLLRALLGSRGQEQSIAAQPAG